MTSRARSETPSSIAATIRSLTLLRSSPCNSSNSISPKTNHTRKLFSLGILIRVSAFKAQVFSL